MAPPIAIVVAVSISIPLVVRSYRHLRGTAPSDREKRVWLYAIVLFIVVDIGLRMPDDFGVLQGAAATFDPILVGAIIGSWIVVIYYYRRYGWIDAGDDSSDSAPA